MSATTLKTASDIKQELDAACARFNLVLELGHRADELQQEGKLEEANELLEQADILLSLPF